MEIQLLEISTLYNQFIPTCGWLEQRLAGVGEEM